MEALSVALFLVNVLCLFVMIKEHLTQIPAQRIKGVQSQLSSTLYIELVESENFPDFNCSSYTIQSDKIFSIPVDAIIFD